MAETRKVEKLAVVLPDGTKSDVDAALAKKYGLIPGGTTPFSRNPTSTVTRTIEQKRGRKKWTTEEDEYLFSHWDTTTKETLEDRFMVSTATLAKRYKHLLAEQEKKERKARRSTRKKKTTKASSKNKKS